MSGSYPVDDGALLIADGIGQTGRDAFRERTHLLFFGHDLAFLLAGPSSSDAPAATSSEGPERGGHAGGAAQDSPHRAS
jgi:hypothetical protein